MLRLLSVIICTHNPREDYLQRVLKALEDQTLSKDHWELLLIDNASKDFLSEKWNLSWHTKARHVREQELGLTTARLRGIRESRGDLLVFVDDDNVLANDYLEQASTLASEKPWVGAFGGNINPEFECKPEESLGKLVDWVGVVRVTEEKWALAPNCSAMNYAPIGAGMVVRRIVAEHYLNLSDAHPLRKNLDRVGTSLLCHGDTDLALCSCDIGLAVGQFPQIQLTHLIPSRRVREEYIFSLIESAAFSDAIFRYIREGQIPCKKPEFVQCRSEKLFRAYQKFRNNFRGKIQPKTNEEKFDEAWGRGVEKAHLQIYTLANSNNGDSSIIK